MAHSDRYRRSHGIRPSPGPMPRLVDHPSMYRRTVSRDAPACQLQASGSERLIVSCARSVPAGCLVPPRERSLQPRSLTEGRWWHDIRALVWVLEGLLFPFFPLLAELHTLYSLTMR